ncbi:MtrAB system histidine kinase MtrB [Nostocoides sp. HKS02]|uniref:MtrAB system histidine kinase MtrB n=1 Tax=Nostocoides sp. HKS02 TaxID=1813880 RepID=UPI0012B4BF57|nr:MtrAB system histidine kinase MtrB [Tetrasphaera sp. HKS02]QGN56693.1 HAMP domain-containing protein [Tetrasphaera sp. HKS02]
MAESARPRPERAPTPRFSDHRAQALAALRSAVRGSRRAVADGARRLVHTWRSSLQFRVVSSTMLLGLAVVLMLGTYLFQSISDGLEQDRMDTAQVEAARLVTDVQGKFDQTTAATNTPSLNLFAQTVIKGAASQGGDTDRQLVFTRSLGNTSPTFLNTVLSGRTGLTNIPMELRQAVHSDPHHQQLQLIAVTDPQSGGVVPAVVVGSQVDVPVAGKYDLYAVYPMQREEATLSLVTRTFALGGFFLVLLVGAVAWVVTRQVVNPVRRAAIVAERLSSGRLNERMGARGADDLARLAKSFNEMADSLQTQIRQLEGLSRLQQRFVSDVSHELRTPLTTIRMAADLIHDSRRDFDPTVSRSAELLHNELDRFEELLADLLEISRFDAGAAALDAEVIDLRDTVARAVDAAQPVADRWGTTITVETSGPCDAEIDARRVERILRNLVVNALEHGEGRPVEITLAGDEHAVAVTVRDHGVGLRPGEAALVFNRFWRADPARARTTGGTGLGLAISLEDARLHEGWLQAWGEPGAGSSFRLTLPRRLDVPIVDSPLPLRPPDAPPQEAGAEGARAGHRPGENERVVAARHTSLPRGGPQ